MHIDISETGEPHPYTYTDKAKEYYIVEQNKQVFSRLLVVDVNGMKQSGRWGGFHSENTTFKTKDQLIGTNLVKKIAEILQKAASWGWNNSTLLLIAAWLC